MADHHESNSADSKSKPPATEKTAQDLLDENIRLSCALAELSRRQKKLVEQERMNALGQMTSGITHDFNNALMPILGLTEHLLKHPDLLDRREETVVILKEINDSAQHAADLIRKLSGFYRKSDENEIEPVDLRKLVDDVVATTRPFWKKQMAAEDAIIKFVVDIQDSPILNGNTTQMRQVFTNLILNAINAMPEGGTIKIHGCQQDQCMVLTIADTGQGMPPEVRERCFEPFFSTKSKKGGTGIGLSIAYGIINEHDGEISVESTENEGTTFTIRLPIMAATARSKPDDGTANSWPWPVPQNLRILIVDGEERSRNFISRHLRQQGHEVVAMPSGQATLEKFKEEHFDLVVTDMAMPDMSGNALATSIKKIRPEIPVLMVTGFGEYMKATGKKPRDADALLGKPFTAEELGIAMAKVMADGV